MSEGCLACRRREAYELVVRLVADSVQRVGQDHADHQAARARRLFAEAINEGVVLGWWAADDEVKR
jgi:hypothetical protein